ncbi:MAG TPA: peptidoglycan-binding domain-containing protein [Thiolinea sp.]|nr:peptidoglycan-binding domain-containing protein [Thiolinea sp.]
MTTLTRSAFLQELAGTHLSLARARSDARLGGIDFGALDRNRDGYLAGDEELGGLFEALDHFDRNGQRDSIELGTLISPTRVGIMVNVLRALAEPLAGPVPGPSAPRPLPAAFNGFRDRALASAFPSGLQGQLLRGARGPQVVALQYALGRLDLLHDLCDGVFGSLTRQAVMACQNRYGLVTSGNVDQALLQRLDLELRGYDARTPAARAADPLAYLSDFRTLGLPPIRLNSTAEVFNWGSRAIRTAFGVFVGHYWTVMKQNRVEGDCKNIALFLMDQFRKQLKQDRMVDLPHPVLYRGEREKAWIVATPDRPQGLFTRADRLARTSPSRVRRPGYQAVLNIQALDPAHSMLYGVNVHYPEISADRVAKSTTRLFDWDPLRDNRGDSRRPEVPVDQLEPGNVIFIDHSGDGSFDHTVTVITVEKDTAGHTRRLVLAVGSYDDVRDTSSATSVEGVGLAIVNVYAEEVTVMLDAAGRVVSSTVSWSSEPDYVVDGRYSARTTLMEQRSGGRVIVSRWG